MTAPRPRILVVDDVIELATMLGHALRHEGFDVTVAHTIEAAVAELTNTGSVDAAIIDVNLGADDGVELAQRLRALSPGAAMPIIGFSGDRRRPAGVFDGFLVKPAGVAQVVAALRVVGVEPPSRGPLR